MIRTIDEFNNKWGKYLGLGHYGIDIANPLVIKYLDSEFEIEIKSNPSFEYYQIKLKFGMARVYTSSEKDNHWQTEIDKMMGNKGPSIFAPADSGLK